jgi:hypothetical protein
MELNLPLLPDMLRADLKTVAQALANPDSARVPHLFAPDSLDLPTAVHRALALIDYGITAGKLDPVRARLLDEYANYLLCYQYDEDEDFTLAGAALALVGMTHSHKDNKDILDPRYGYGLARMCYPLKNAPETVDAVDSAAVSFVVHAAQEKGLPLLAELASWTGASGGALHLGDSPERFMRGLSLPGEWGNRLRGALSAGDLKAAGRVVAEYYAGKIAPFAPERVRVSREEIAEADELLRNVFILRAHMYRRHDFGATVDWTTVLDGDIESNVSINNQPHLLLLARVWRATGETKYRDKLIELLSSWLAQSPRPDIGQTGLQWRTLEAGARASTRWPQLMALAAGDSEFVDSMFFPLVYGLYQHADYLMVHNMRHLSNWGQVETAGLLASALVVSEHRDAELFRTTAMRRFDYLNREMYFPDGLHTENSFYYHEFPLLTQAAVYELAQSLGAELDMSWSGVLVRGMEALVLGALPDGSKPMVGDTGPYKSYVGALQKLGRRLFPKNELFIHPVGIPEYPVAVREHARVLAAFQSVYAVRHGFLRRQPPARRQAERDCLLRGPRAAP